MHIRKFYNLWGNYMKRKKFLLLFISVVVLMIILAGFATYNRIKENSKITSQVINSDNKTTTDSSGDIDGIYQYINNNSKDTYNADLKKLSNKDISIHYTVQASHIEDDDENSHYHNHDLDTIDYASGILSRTDHNKWTGTLTNLITNTEWDVEATLSGNNLNLNFTSSKEFKISNEEKIIISQNPNYKLNLALTKLASTSK